MFFIDCYRFIQLTDADNIKMINSNEFIGLKNEMQPNA